jgi:glucose-1-phosphate cytidylyltransferase
MGNMKAIILAGGLGSRLAEETALRPKPMVEVGGHPILWHIMNIIATHGINEFIIALGYRAEVIKQYFLNFYAVNSDISVDLSSGTTTVLGNYRTNWKVHLVDTGSQTQTGGRLKRLAEWLQPDETFLFAYGDGVADLDLTNMLRFHKAHGKLATVATVMTPERFGRIAYEGDRVSAFYEKPERGNGWINGGFFFLQPKAISYIESDDTAWERAPVEGLARDGQLMGFRHNGFWSCMDTVREKDYLDQLWSCGNPPWRIWKD